MKNLLFPLVNSIFLNVAKEKKEQDPIHSSEVKTTRKLSISLSDMQTISMALMHYERFLKNRQDFAKAAVVTTLDERIYEIIQSLSSIGVVQEESITKQADAA